ncbi:MAG: peptidyl-prolyl cis-trans isomerase [Nitrospirae bacterium]|nr:MAG: peptidyl-prolyl cis-trans isomerase [Nitrospirota bacterium]
MKTTLGTMVFELYPDKAPITVANFLRYVDEGFYDNTLFHRVVPHFVIQGGGYGPGMTPKPTHKPIKNEAGNGLRNVRGTIAMARTLKPHSATSQFFINLVDNPNLDHVDDTLRGWGYCVFGKIVKGRRVMDRIGRVPTDRHQRPKKEVVILSVRRLTPPPPAPSASGAPAKEP